MINRLLKRIELAERLKELRAKSFNYTDFSLFTFDELDELETLLQKAKKHV